MKFQKKQRGFLASARLLLESQEWTPQRGLGKVP